MHLENLQGFDWSKNSPESGQVGRKTGSVDDAKCHRIDAKIRTLSKFRLQFDFVAGIRI